MSSETTQIPVTKNTRQKLRNISAKGETYDQIVKELIESQENVKEAKKFRQWFENNFQIFGFDGLKHSKHDSTYILERNGEDKKVELEILSSDFLKHGHDPSSVDLLICLLEDEESPVETKEITDLDLKTDEIGQTSKNFKFGKAFLLLELTEKNADVSPVEITLEELAQRLERNEEIVSRWLDELSEQGFVQRESNENSERLALTQDGLKILTDIWERLRDIFCEGSEKIELKGEVVSGLGEGGYYIGQEGYQTQFKEKIGFESYPGTLDLKLNPSSLKLKKWLKMRDGLEIEGFSTEERSFGSAKAFPSKIKDEEAAIVLPYRTHHEEDILEIIAPVELRDEFELEDGDELKIEVEI